MCHDDKIKVLTQYTREDVIERPYVVKQKK